MFVSFRECRWFLLHVSEPLKFVPYMNLNFHHFADEKNTPNCRGVTSAMQYGDSYLVLKDVRSWVDVASKIFNQKDLT